MAPQPRTLSGRTAAITGGARGIGRETARALLAEGMRVAIGDIDLDLARATAAELGPGGQVIALPLDVTDPTSMEAFVADAEEQLGPLDVFINNAGIMPIGRFRDETPAGAARQVDINIHGVLNGARTILPRFTARRGGHLVNIASMAGKLGVPGTATYAGTKHFVVGWSESVLSELRHDGVPVDVTCVMPAVVRTELSAGAKATRGVKDVGPEDVADGIVAALKVPRFDVFVPRIGGTAAKVSAVLPRRGRELLARATKADVTLLEADTSKRGAYELRAAQNPPRQVQAASDTDALTATAQARRPEEEPGA